MAHACDYYSYSHSVVSVISYILQLEVYWLNPFL